MTGASAGIGKATALGLAKLGATVIMPCRNMEKGNSAASEIESRVAGARVIVMPLDLRSQSAIRSFVKDFQTRFHQLDVLINNAGVINKKNILTKDGIEETLAVNVLAPFMLNNLLMNELLRAPQGRIINVSSAMHRRSVIHFDDINGEKKYSGLKAYSQTALARILITYEQAHKLRDTPITVNCLHPGGINTDIGKNNRGFLTTLYNLIRPFQRTPEHGAETSLYLAGSDEVKNVSGRYFIDQKQSESSKLSYDKGLASRCWELCENLTGITTMK